MGANVSNNNTQLLLYDLKKFQSSTVFSEFNINPVFKQTIADLNQESPEFLKRILTSDTKKSELLKLIRQKKLPNTSLYVYIQGTQKNNQMDQFNPAIVKISNVMEELLQMISNKEMDINYNPLSILTREMQVKVQVKIIQEECNNQLFLEVYNKLIQQGCSVQVCESFEKYKQSLLFSSSDFLLCRRNSVYSKDFQKQDTKCFQDVIYYEQSTNMQIKYWFFMISSDKKRHQKLVPIDTSKYNMSKQTVPIYQIKLLYEYIKGNAKYGYKQEPIEKVFLISRVANKSAIKKQRRIKRIEQFKDIYDKKIQIIECEDNKQLFNNLEQELKKEYDNEKKNLEKKQYFAILFLHHKSGNLRRIMKELQKKQIHRKVVVLSMKSFPMKNKTQNIVPHFRIQKKITKVLDVVDKNIKDERFKKLIQHLQIYTNLRTFETTDEYLDQQRFRNRSPFVICNYKNLLEIKEKMPKLNNSKLKFICFDAAENIIMLKKEMVFDKEKFKDTFYAQDVIRIGDIIKQNYVDELILHEISHQKQASYYNVITQKYYVMKKKGKVIEFQVEINARNYNVTQQVNFIMDPNYDSNWNQMFKDFIVQYSQLWKMQFIPTDDVKRLKKDCIKSLKYLKRNEIIQTSDSVFYQNYIRKIEGCTSMNQLSSTAIYIFSLPHGLGSILNYLLMNFTTNFRAIPIFKPLLFIFMLNYNIIFQPKYQLEKKTLQVFFNKFWEKDTKFSVNLRKGEKIYNTNFMECWESLQQQKDYIQIQYDYCSFSQMSPYYNILYTEPASFYKSGSGYTFSPYSCFQIKEVTTIKGYNVIRVKHIPNYDFISELFKVNFNCSNPTQAKFIPLSLTGQKTFVQGQKLNETLQAVTYYNLLCAMSQNRIYEAELQNEKDLERCKNNQIKNIHIKAFKHLEKVWIEIKKGEFQIAKKMLEDNKLNTLTSKLQIDFNKISKLVDRISQARRRITDNTYFQILKSKQKQEKIFWDCKYEQKVDQFVLCETKNQNQKSKDLQFGFVQIPENFCFYNNQSSSADSAFGEVLAYSKIKSINIQQLILGNLVKNYVYDQKKEQYNDILIDMIKRQIMEQEIQSCSSEEQQHQPKRRRNTEYLIKQQGLGLQKKQLPEIVKHKGVKIKKGPRNGRVRVLQEQFIPFESRMDWKKMSTIQDKTS